MASTIRLGPRLGVSVRASIASWLSSIPVLDGTSELSLVCSLNIDINVRASCTGARALSCKKSKDVSLVFEAHTKPIAVGSQGERCDPGYEPKVSKSRD